MKFTRFFRPVVEGALRTAVAAVLSLVVARLCRLPEFYWAPITTFVIIQSNLGAAVSVSAERLAGTALGVGAGVLLSLAHPAWAISHGVIFSAVFNLVIFGAGVFLLGLICGALHLGNAAYRFAGITVAIVLLIPRAIPAWKTATHRFLEVSIGIVIGLAVTAAWPEKSSSQ